MTDLATMRKMLGMTDNFIPVREQKMLWEELTYRMRLPLEDRLPMPAQVATSLMRALVAAESQLAEATAHLSDKDEVDIVTI